MKIAPIGILAVILLWAGENTPLRGAAIIWGAPTTITGDTNVSTVGTLDRAFNFGATSAPVGTVTINGTAFAFFDVGGLPTRTIGNTSLATNGSSLSGTSEVGFASAPFSDLSANYQSLLANSIFGTASDTLTLTLNGLVNGQAYLLQFWTNDSRVITADRTITGTATNSVTLDYNVLNSNGGLGQFADGTFIADATSQVVTFTGGTVGAVGPAPQLNAFQVRAVPEPSSAALSLLGLALLSFRRFVRGKRL